MGFLKLFSKIFKKKQRSKILVLLVEDNPICLKAELGIIKSLGLDLKVFVAKSGMDALKLLEENNFDFIVLDLVLPDIDGVNILKILNYSENLKSKVVVISATKKDYTALACLSLNAVAFLVKPITANDLMEIFNKP